MCAKINVLYVQLFTLAGPTHFARISKITTRQIRNVNVCKCCEQR